MNFDDLWNWDEEPGVNAGAGGRNHAQKLPDGTHTGDIVKVAIKDDKYMVSDDNPQGTVLVVTWSKEGYCPVESKTSVRWRAMIEAICRAAGVAPPQRGEEWEPESLVGRVATIDVENAVSKRGNEYQRVKYWHASPQKPLPPAPRKKAAARTPAAKAHEEFAGRAADDDIPF